MLSEENPIKNHIANQITYNKRQSSKHRKLAQFNPNSLNFPPQHLDSRVRLTFRNLDAPSSLLPILLRGRMSVAKEMTGDREIQIIGVGPICLCLLFGVTVADRD